MLKSTKKRVTLLLAIAVLIFPAAMLFGQETNPVVYEIGKSMIELILKQEAFNGASPAEIEGLRQGIAQQLEDSSLSITLRQDGVMRLEINGDSQELQYRENGSKLMVMNLQTGEYVQFGFFSKDMKTLTLSNGTILDKVN